MDWDEARPAPKRAITVGEDLKAMALAELEARVAALAAEIGRVEAEIALKRAHGKAADDIFKR